MCGGVFLISRSREIDASVAHVPPPLPLRDWHTPPPALRIHPLPAHSTRRHLHARRGCHSSAFIKIICKAYILFLFSPPGPCSHPSRGAVWRAVFGFGAVFCLGSVRRPRRSTAPARPPHHPPGQKKIAVRSLKRFHQSTRRLSFTPQSASIVMWYTLAVLQRLITLTSLCYTLFPVIHTPPIPSPPVGSNVSRW